MRNLFDFESGQAIGDLPHVVAHLLDGFREGNRRAVFVQQQESLADFFDNLRFLPAEPGRFDFVVVRALGFGHLVESNGAVVNRGLHLEHFTEAGGELRECALELLFAKLAKDAFEFGFGLLQFFDGLQSARRSLPCELTLRFSWWLPPFAAELRGAFWRRGRPVLAAEGAFSAGRCFHRRDGEPGLPWRRWRVGRRRIAWLGRFAFGGLTLTWF